MKFYLYRLKVILPRQKSIEEEINPIPSRDKLIDEIIKSTGSFESKSGSIWRIGNIHEINSVALSFALGRTTYKNINRYDEESREYFNIDVEDDPYVQVIIDKSLGVCGFGYNNNLSSKMDSVVNCFKGLVERSDISLKYDLRFLVEEVNDPDKFIQYVRDCYTIEEFTLNISRPNPPDADALIVKPMQNAVEGAGGNEGLLTVGGGEIDKVVVEGLANSAAATGDQLSARMKMAPNEKAVKKKLSGDQASIELEALDLTPKNIWEQLMARYRGIRGE